MAERNETVNTRIEYLDLLRILATFFVIVIHVSIQGWSDTDTSSFAWKSMNTWNSLARWSVPVFIMISGTLFLDPKRKIGLGKLYRKNIWRVLKAFFFWSLLYAIFHMVVNGWSFHTFVVSIFTGYYHEWFILMIVGLYLIVPVMRKITASTQATLYFIVLAFVFGFLIPSIRDQIIPYSTLLSGSDIISALDADFESMSITFVAGYTGYFALGYYLKKVRISANGRLVIYILGMIGFILTVIPTAYISGNLGKPVNSYYAFISVNVFFMSMAVYVLFKYLRINYSEKILALKKKIADNCFGIFLVHLFIIEILELIGFDSLTFAPAVSIPLISLATFVVGYYIVEGLRRIKFIERNFI